MREEEKERRKAKNKERRKAKNKERRKAKNGQGSLPLSLCLSSLFTLFTPRDMSNRTIQKRKKGGGGAAKVKEWWKVVKKGFLAVI